MIFKYSSRLFLQRKGGPPPFSFSVRMNTKFGAFISNSPQKALLLLILNEVDFTSHPE